MGERMTKEERLDWLCRLRAFLVSVGMPNEWRAKFTQALSDSITELSVEQSENTMMDAAINEWRGEMDNAIKRALEKQRWIPVSERLPERNGQYLVTKAIGDYTYIGCMDYSTNLAKTDKFDFHGKNYAGWYEYDMEYGFLETDGVIAWMPLPEPYKGESEDAG